MKIKEAVLYFIALVVLTGLFTLSWSGEGPEMMHHIHHDSKELLAKNDFLRGQAELLEGVLNFRNQYAAERMTQKVDEGKLEVVAAQIEKSLPEVEAMPVTVAVAIAQDPKIVDPMVQSRQKESVSVSAPTVAIKGGPNLHIVTYASHGGRDDRFCRAVESAYHHSIKLTILGWGEKWLGLSQKLTAAYNYAKSIPPTDVLMFVDAFDVMFAGTPEYIMEQFRASSKTGVLFAAECGCWPQIMENKGHDCFYAYPKSPTPYRYLNSGTWIGIADQSAAMLLDIINKAGSDFANANDQKLVSDMFIHKQHGIELDYYSRVFQSMHMTDRPLAHCAPGGDVTTPTQRAIAFPHNSSVPISYYNAVTQSIPAVYHFNGGGKTYHLKYESGMWYRQKQREQLRSSRDRAAVFEGLANYRLRVIPSIATTLVDSEVHFMPFKDLCGSYVNHLINDPQSL